jgi:DNA-binding FadR family transcriptional regulator
MSTVRRHRRAETSTSIRDIEAFSSAPAGRIRVPKAAEVVAAKFRAQIIRGELTPRDMLPPETQLVHILGISRPTLREALRILEAEGLIAVVPGSRLGARVRQPSVSSVAARAGHLLQSIGTTIGELYDARFAVEPHVVHQLAGHRDQTAVAMLRKEIERLEQLLSDGHLSEFMQSTSSFHRVLVEASGNSVLMFLNQLLLSLLELHQAAHIKRSPVGSQSLRKRLVATVASYTALVELIDKGDADGAAAHWRCHLHNANTRWIAGKEATRIVDVLGS